MSRFVILLSLQAYTNELELEVAHLMEENARLKRQQEQVTQKPNWFLLLADKPWKKHPPPKKQPKGPLISVSSLIHETLGCLASPKSDNPNMHGTWEQTVLVNNYSASKRKKRAINIDIVLLFCFWGMQLRVAAAAQLSKKRTLQRTSTAPFWGTSLPTF